MHKRVPVYLSTLFLSLSYAVILYINSSYLEKFFSPENVDLIFIAAALGSILLFLSLPAILQAIGNRKAFVLFLLGQITGLAGLISASSASTVAGSFIVYSATILAVYYCLDVFIEDITVETHTGEVRGIVLTFENLSIAAAPLIFSALTFDGEFRPVYVASMLLLLPVVYIGIFSFRKFRDGRARHSFSLPFFLWKSEKEIYKATIARFILETFYTIMVIFMPLYLSQVIGFSWHDIGIIFATMLLAFVFFELPAGELADHWQSERGIMTTGFILLGISTLLTAFIGASMLLWIIVLFVSRIGASFVEITSEAHFFRHVTKKDTGLISIFRLTRPGSIIVGSLLGAIVLYLSSYQMLFYILALIAFVGIKQSRQLVSTHPRV